MDSLALFYLTILMYVTPAGEIVSNTTPGAIERIAPGITGAHGPDKAACEKWGDEVRKAMAKEEKKLKDYRQLKYRCELRP